VCGCVQGTALCVCVHGFVMCVCVCGFALCACVHGFVMCVCVHGYVQRSLKCVCAFIRACVSVVVASIASRDVVAISCCAGKGGA